MQIIKPSVLGLIHRTYFLKTQMLAIAGLQFFHLRKPSGLLPENDAWLKLTGALPPLSAIDQGFAKGTAEVLLYGQAYTQRVGVFPVCRPGFRLGDCSRRTLFVPRQRPQELTPFHPLDIDHAQRQQYQGTYTEAWLQDHPYQFPEDTDLRLFNTAPHSQQCRSGNLVPGAPFTLFDVDPDERQVSGTLPAEQVRVVASLRGSVSELDVTLDTVVFLPEIDIGVAVYRAVLQVADELASNVDTLLIAADLPGDAATRSADHYEQLIALRQDPESAMGHAFFERPLLPALTEAQALEHDAIWQSEKLRHAAQVEAHKARALAEVPAATPATGDETTDDSGVIPVSLLKQGEVDLTPIIREARRKQEALLAEAEKQVAQARATFDEPQPGSVSPETREAFLKRVSPATTDLAGLEAALAGCQSRLEQGDLAATQELIAISEEVALTSRRDLRRNATQVTSGVHSITDCYPGARDIVLAKLARGDSLAGCDLAGVDLSEVRFTGGSLKGALFEKANLQGAVFDQVDLEDVTFTGADLEGVRFNHCPFRKTNLSGVHADAVQFINCSFVHVQMIDTALSHVTFQDAVFDALVADRCRFASAQLRNVTFDASLMTDCHFEHATWRDVSANRTMFTICHFEAARLTRCEAGRTLFLRTDLALALLEDCIFKTVHFGEGTLLTGATLRRCRLVECGLRSTLLQGVRLKDTVVIDTDATGADLSSSDLNDVFFRGSLLTGAGLENAEVNRCDFVESDLRHASLDRAFIRSSRFCTSHLADIGFDDGHIEQTTFHPPTYQIG